MSIELKAKLFISADLVLICWSLNQQICTDLIASQTNILYSHNCVIMYLLNSLAVDNSYILYQHYLNENIPAKGIIVLTLISEFNMVSEQSVIFPHLSLMLMFLPV